jgi:hypothetical protein
MRDATSERQNEKKDERRSEVIRVTVEVPNQMFPMIYILGFAMFLYLCHLLDPSR